MGSTKRYLEIKAKTDELYDRYGGMMGTEEMKKEFGLRSVDGVNALVKRMDIPIIKVGRFNHYETSIVAKRIVDARDMC